MPDHAKPNVFAREFLHRAREREPPPLAALEAAWAGPWTVQPQGDSFLVRRATGGEPEAVTELRETALLLAAIFPLAGRTPLYWIGKETVDGKSAVTLETLQGRRGLVTAGRLRVEQQGLVERLSVAEYLLRSPTALALLLEAAPFETLEQAGAALARRMSESVESRGEPTVKRE